MGIDACEHLKCGMGFRAIKDLSPVMVLCMVELEDGLSLTQAGTLLRLLPEDGKYIPVSFHENNTSAYGLIEAEYFQTHDYDTTYLEPVVLPILDDKNRETENGIYRTPDGSHFYMGYLQTDI